MPVLLSSTSMPMAAFRYSRTKDVSRTIATTSSGHSTDEPKWVVSWRSRMSNAMRPPKAVATSSCCTRANSQRRRWSMPRSRQWHVKKTLIWLWLTSAAMISSVTSTWFRHLSLRWSLAARTLLSAKAKPRNWLATWRDKTPTVMSVGRHTTPRCLFRLKQAGLSLCTTPNYSPIISMETPATDLSLALRALKISILPSSLAVTK